LFELNFVPLSKSDNVKQTLAESPRGKVSLDCARPTAFSMAKGFLFLDKLFNTFLKETDAELSAEPSLQENPT
jgi:hypothetical protein